MGGRGGALRNTPVLAHSQQRGFLLSAGHRDTKIVLAGHHPERNIRLVGGQQSGQLRLIQRLPAQRGKMRLFPRRQQSHRPYAVPPDLGQQIERLFRTRLIAPDDPLADLRAVGQQVIKIVIHRVGGDIAILQRQREGERSGARAAQPLLIIAETVGPVGLAG